MGIRFPFQTVVQSTNSTEVGAGSVGGGVIIGPFVIPQDADNIVLKLVASVAGAGVSAQLQTTDDGGSTWFGLGRTSVVSNAVGDNAAWLSVSTSAGNLRSSSIVATGSVVAGAAIGSAQPSTLSSNSYSGLPILSPTARVILQIVGNVTVAAANQIVTTVSANQNGPGAA